MKKKFMIFLIATILTFSLVGCSVPEDTETNNSGVEIEINSCYNAYEFIDPDTGVHYWIYSHKVMYGGAGGMTPRLNSDGTVMVTK